MNLIEAEGISKRFRTGGPLSGRARRHVVRALEDVSLAIPRGQTLALVGESGSGKSTLGRVLLRLIEPDTGSIRFDGDDLRQLRTSSLRRWRSRAQIVFQDAYGSFDPRRTIEGAMLRALRIHRAGLNSDGRKTLVQDGLMNVGLSTRILDAYPHQLSGGQLQRAAIARALLLDPEFLVLDEPAASLDVSVQAQVMNLIQELQSKLGLTYLFITHDLRVVPGIADNMAVMTQGRIVERGPVTQVMNAPQHPYTQALLDSVPGSIRI